MGAELTIISLGIMAFVMLYFANSQSEKHFFPKILAIFLAMIFLFYIPKVLMLNNAATCSYTIGESNVSYSPSCSINDTAITSSVNKMGVWWIIFFCLYVGFYVFYDLFANRIGKYLEKYVFFHKMKEKRW